MVIQGHFQAFNQSSLGTTQQSTKHEHHNILLPKKTNVPAEAALSPEIRMQVLKKIHLTS
jgi:hypothetical protein